MALSRSSSVGAGWLNLDAWSETYVGVHWLLSNVLPKHPYQAEAHHGPISQMVLLTAHHLNEVMFYRCVREILIRNPEYRPEIEKDKRAGFRVAVRAWPQKLVGKPFDFTSEPFSSLMRLAERRNATVHQESALTSVEMARSAVSSAVASSRAIAVAMLGPAGFNYEPVLVRYPLPDAVAFSKVGFIEEPT